MHIHTMSYIQLTLDWQSKVSCMYVGAQISKALVSESQAAASHESPVTLHAYGHMHAQGLALSHAPVHLCGL